MNLAGYGYDYRLTLELFLKTRSTALEGLYMGR